MRSTRQVATRSLPPASPDGFENLRQEFLKRLGVAGSFFTTSSAELARAADDAAPILHDLCARAHRLQGGAAIFEFAEIEAAAGALEEAAAAAIRSQANNSDAGVWITLAALIKIMATMDGNGACNAELPASACINKDRVDLPLSESTAGALRMP